MIILKYKNTNGVLVEQEYYNSANAIEWAAILIKRKVQFTITYK